MNGTDSTISIQVDMTATVNFSLLNTGFPVLRSVEIINSSDTEYTGITLSINSDSDIIEPFSREIDYLAPSSSITLRDIAPVFNTAQLASMTEKTGLTLDFSLYGNAEADAPLCTYSQKIELLAFDEWCGSGIYPEVLAAFCVPNHPSVSTVLSRASVILQDWTTDPSFDAYQTENPDRVLKQAAAIYTALLEQNIAYCVSPASFEAYGQRIRMTDSCLGQKLGNCIDLSLCYCSCLEAAGLNPFLVLKNDHAFAGVWLDNMTFPETVQYDPASVSKRMAGGVNELAVIECTCLAAGRSSGFEEACAAAEKHFSEPEKIEYIIDIKRARMSRITPLPLRVKTENGYTVSREALDPSQNTAAPAGLRYSNTAINCEETVFDRKTLWERKLLDLGLRNQLINLRMSKCLIPLLTPSLDSLEDRLSDGGEFSIQPRPSDFTVSESDITFDNLHEIFSNRELLESEFKSKRLRSSMNETLLAKTVKELYRSAKSSLEENGANTLYMALGLLRWYETEKSVKPRYAPIVLIPIEMVRKSAASGYTIRLRDDEPQMNITMLEKLKQDFGINISGLDPLPADEHGIDLRTVYTIMRKNIMSLPKWDILESAYLGIFTFSQFVMWNDIRNRSQDLEKNKIVKSLVDQRLAWDAAPMNLPDKIKEEDVLLPLSADASQAFAIKEAAEGNSFVLHGPPGTGKSQTITALIANALASGKTVLFVAEKMAALSVVEKRLSKLGIGDFCLELHSNRSRKRDVLDQLNNACRITKTTSPAEYAKSAEKIQKLREELDRYCQILHRKDKSGYTCYELISIYEENSRASDSVILSADSLAQMNEADIEACIETVNNLVASGRAMGHPHGHPLRKIKVTDYDHSLSGKISDAISGYLPVLAKIRPETDNICRLFAHSVPVEFIQLQNFLELAESVNSCFDFPAEWISQDNYSAFFDNLISVCDSFDRQFSAYSSLSEKWTDAFFTMDAGSLLNQYREAQGAFLFMKGIKMNSLVKQLTFCSKTEINRETLADELTALLNYKTLENTNAKLLLGISEAVNTIPHVTAADWNSIRNNAHNARAVLDRLTALRPDPAFRKNLCTDSAVRPQLEKLLSVKKEYEAAQSIFYKSINSSPTATEVSAGTDFLTQEQNDCNTILNSLDSLKDICLWNHFAALTVQRRIGSVAKAYADGLPHDEVLPSFYKAMSNALISHIIDTDDYLKTFSDAMFNDKIRQFRELDARVMELTKQEIYAKLAANVPNFQVSSAQSSETGILQRAIKSNGRGTSIRKLFSQIPNLLPRLTPCMLMSPLSAAQYLDPAGEQFDLVVFDEASQLTTAKAVGAIARGKNAIIVGDPNQMPPTSFFMSDSTDEDNLDIEDLESILDDCLALEMPQTHLLWHYRSRHESLIAFSNSEFYENRLFTFPSVNDRESKVSFVPVEGFFDRGKTRQNHAEAEAIVEEIKRRFNDESCNTLSLGVVTFNISQSNLIDDLITEACSSDPALEDWLYNQEEPLFIKNLENVQGDERDVILFSVGYGTDREGKTYMNFGPLNRDGGWRRLNVAVSRARYEMKVFSSLTGDQIDLARTGSMGVAALKAFLLYAQKGILRNNTLTNKRISDHSGTVMSVCQALEEKGYKTATDIGHSGYRIDIGVLDPDNPSDYLLGIVLDGPVYAAAQTTRDRELSQISVLEGLGWSIARIWSVGWWDNQKRELDNLLKKLEEVRKNGNKLAVSGANSIKPVKKPEKATEGSIKEPSEAVSTPAASGSIENLQGTVSKTEADKNPGQTTEEALPVYTPVELPVLRLTVEELLASEYKKDIRQRMTAVLEAEAPLPKDRLYKKILSSYGIARSTAKINGLLDSCLEALKVPVTEQFGEDFVWSRTITPDTIDFFRTSVASDSGRRDIKDINLAELEQAVIYVTEHQISLSMEDLVRETAKLFGFNRMSETISNQISGGIHFAMIDNRVKFDANGRIVLCTIQQSAGNPT